MYPVLENHYMGPLTTRVQSNMDPSRGFEPHIPEKKLCTKRTVIDRAKRSKTMFEVKLYKNINKNPQSHNQKEVPPLCNLKGNVYE